MEFILPSHALGFLLADTGSILTRTMGYHTYFIIFFSGNLVFYQSSTKWKHLLMKQKSYLWCVQWIDGGKNMLRGWTWNVCWVLTCLLWQITSELARQSHQLSAVFARPLPPDYTRDVSLPPPVAVSSAAAHLQAPHSLPPFTARWGNFLVFVSLQNCQSDIEYLHIDVLVIPILNLAAATTDIKSTVIPVTAVTAVAINTINATLPPQPSQPLTYPSRTLPQPPPPSSHQPPVFTFNPPPPSSHQPPVNTSVTKATNAITATATIIKTSCKMWKWKFEFLFYFPLVGLFYAWGYYDLLLISYYSHCKVIWGSAHADWQLQYPSVFCSDSDRTALLACRHLCLPQQRLPPPPLCCPWVSLLPRAHNR